MAVPEQTPYKEYTANGVTTSFPLEFDCDNQDHLIVTVNDIEPENGQWSLINGAVVFLLAPANQAKIIIQRNTPLERNTDYQTYNNSFRPQPVNKDLDRIWWKLQELWVQVSLLWAQIGLLWSGLKNEIKDRIAADLAIRSWVLVLLNNIVDSGLVSAIAVTTVDSISDLNNLIAWEGRTVYVKSYHQGLGKGGGTRIYNYARRNENDSFSCINGWVLQITGYPDAYQAGARGDGVFDDIDALQRLVNAFCVTTFKGFDNQKWSISNRKVIIKAGAYRITKPLLVGAGIEIEFENPCDNESQPYISRSAVLLPDFADPYDFVIKSANFDVNGNQQPYNIFSDVDRDGGKYTTCANVKIKNPFIFCDKQVFGGIKLCGSPRSVVAGFNIRNTAYGVAMSDSWASIVDGFTNHAICGVLSYRSNNNITVNGYYTKHSTMSLTETAPLIIEKPLGTSVGVYHRQGQAINSTALVSEYNDYNIGIVQSSGFITSLYTENAAIRSGFFSLANVTIGVTNGYWDKATYELTNNSMVTIQAWAQGGYGYGSANSFVPSVSNDSYLFVENGLEFYHSAITYLNNEIIYVTNIIDQTGTYNYFTGLTIQRAVSLDTALTRVAQYNGKSKKRFTLKLINAGEYPLTANIPLSNVDLTIEKLNASDACSIAVSYPMTFYSSKLVVQSVSTSLTTTNDQGYCFGFNEYNVAMFIDGSIAMSKNNAYFARSIANGSILTLGLSNYSWAANQYSALVQMPNATNLSKLMLSISDSSNIANLLLRSDKGLEMNSLSKVIIPEQMKT